MAAYYKDINDLHQGNMHVFGKEEKPGDSCSQEGIYRCQTCKITKIVLSEKTFPSHIHHRPLPEGPVVWELIVANIS